MKKIIAIILFMMTIIMVLTSCSPQNDNATIQIWWYNDNSAGA